MSVAAPCFDAGSDTRSRLEGEGFAAEVILSDLNRRIQVVRFEAEDHGAMVSTLEREAAELGYGKVFLKTLAAEREPLEEAGMEAEAEIAGYFSGSPALVMSSFLREARRERPHLGQQEEILGSIRARPADPSVAPLPDGYVMRVAEPEDAEELAELYGAVFASYPFPITSPEYLEETMRSHIVYRIVRDDSGKVVAAASAETSPSLSNAEMTDFATLPDQRGLGLAQHILAALEENMRERAIWNLYTVARARSAGMNRVFYNRGYRRTGTLVNNCHIAGRFEDMHVWCKGLEAGAREGLRG